MKCFIGWDSREIDAYNVCRKSLLDHTTEALTVFDLKNKSLRDSGVYWRENDAGATEFTYTRFLVPYLSEYMGWSVFFDCDMLFTKDIKNLFDLRDDKYAAMCVKHDYTPRNTVKMDGQKQVAYPRKNWSSMILWNCSHPSNKSLTPEAVSSESPAFLHRFQWLQDEEIGELPIEWNWLEGEYDKPSAKPAVIHYTNGGPWFENCQDVDYAEDWMWCFKEV